MFYALWLYPSKVRQLWGGPKQTEVSHQFVIDHPTWKKACDGDFCSRWCRYAYERGCLMCEPCLASKVLLSHNIVIILNIVTCSMFISISSSSKSIIIISMVSDMSDIVSDILCLIFPISCLNCVWYMWWQVRTKCSKCRNIIDLEGLPHHPHHHHHHHHQDHRRHHHCHHEMVLGKLGLGPTVGHRGPTVHFFWADCWAPDLLSNSFGVWGDIVVIIDVFEQTSSWLWTGKSSTRNVSPARNARSNWKR